MVRRRAFTDAQAREIQHAYWRDRESSASLAERFGVSAQTVRNCVQFTNYPNLIGDVSRRRLPRSRLADQEALMREAVDFWDRSKCWLDWPFATGWDTAPITSLYAHPVTGRRWAGRVVRLLWWRLSGEWPGVLRMGCMLGCWNVWHAVDRKGRTLP